VAIIGDDEVQAGTVLVKNMENGEQQVVQREELNKFMSSDG
jgi:histidyl-tRNA synthetase